MCMSLLKGYMYMCIVTFAGGFLFLLPNDRTLAGLLLVVAKDMSISSDPLSMVSSSYSVSLRLRVSLYYE